MKIVQLQISNIMSFKYFENIDDSPKMTFAPDLNIFIGENGSGKSTALEVINFIFKRVLLKQFVFNQEQFSNRHSLTGPQRRDTISKAHSQINNFRLNPTWGSEGKPQVIRITVQLDDIDKKNIQILIANRDKLLGVAGTYSNIGLNIEDAFIPDPIVIDILPDRQNNNFHVVFPPDKQPACNYLTNYNFFKDLIRIHNAENPEQPVDPLLESFALISSFRNYNSFDTQVSLRDQSGAQQIQIIHDNDFMTSLNSNNEAEPAVFRLVRLKIADHHFDLFGTSSDRKQCEEHANNAQFLKSINKKLSLVKLKCVIKLANQRTWQYKFEFIDTRRETPLTDINSMSAGQKSIIHLVFEAYGRGDLKGGVVIIDEPEIHLHHQFQHEYLRILEEINKEQRCQYVLVTHSETLINSSTIHNVKRFSLDEHGFSKVMSPEISTEQKVLVRILDNTRSTFAFFAKKVVLVEGDSDRYFFKSVLNELKPTSSQDVAIVDIGGKGSLQSWKQFFDSFGLKVYFIGDFDNVFTLKANGTTILNPRTSQEIEHRLKQAKLNNLSADQKQTLEMHYRELVANAEYLQRPPRSLWKPLLDTFIEFSKVDGQSICAEAIRTNPEVERKIEELYQEGLFILKRGDLEKYLGLNSKGLPEIIKFCNESLKDFLKGPSAEAAEIKTIFERFLN